MRYLLGIAVFLFMVSHQSNLWAADWQKDTLKLVSQEVVIGLLNHGSLLLQYEGKNIYIDPSSMVFDFKDMPKADLILITHHHRDHIDSTALAQIYTARTDIILTSRAFEQLQRGKILKNGESVDWGNIRIEAVPAYNLVHKRDNGQPFHVKGECNGYILNLDGKRIYIAGDTENIPEMKALKDIYVAFLPMNLPYTMTPEMVADAIKAFKPKIFYPYHYGNSDLKHLKELLKDARETELRIRKMP